jgi:hypothetical protein
MARRQPRPRAPYHRTLEPLWDRCPGCGGVLWVAYHSTRSVLTLEGPYRLRLKVRRCQRPTCPRYRRSYRPEEEGAWALPQMEVGLDVIALVGRLRFAEHRSVPEIHRALQARGIAVAERTVTNLLYRYEELVALHLAEPERWRGRVAAEGRAILAIDGLQPDVGHEVLWVVRECLSGEVLLARSLLSGTTEDLAALLAAVVTALPVPVAGVVSDGQPPIRRAVAQVLPGVPHQLCHFHYLREAAKPIFEADRHAKTQLKKRLRGVRPIERQVAERTDEAATITRGYCLAVRSALTDDGRPPLAAGLRLHERTSAIAASLARVAEKGGCRRSSPSCSACWPVAWRRRRRRGRPWSAPMRGCTRPPPSWPPPPGGSGPRRRRTSPPWGPRWRRRRGTPARWRRRSGTS